MYDHCTHYHCFYCTTRKCSIFPLPPFFLWFWEELLPSPSHNSLWEGCGNRPCQRRPACACERHAAPGIHIGRMEIRKRPTQLKAAFGTVVGRNAELNALGGSLEVLHFSLFCIVEMPFIEEAFDAASLKLSR